MLEINDFITDYPAFRRHCDGLKYDGMTNPVDGVFYPGVTTDIPESVVSDVVNHLREVDGLSRLNAIFLRLSLEGVKAPHQAHTDLTMGERSLMVYLSPENETKWGTSILKHETGLKYNPANEDELWLLLNDMNHYDAWEITHYCEAKPNKGFLFDAGLIHRAEPIGGFGKGPQDGRLVLTAFYDR